MSDYTMLNAILKAAGPCGELYKVLINDSNDLQIITISPINILMQTYARQM